MVRCWNACVPTSCALVFCAIGGGDAPSLVTISDACLGVQLCECKDEP
ncbi:hypothetical protein GLYMA_18G286451v4 [Glycine max]|nr:hypothetical protein GLYMA_18G286451v4 [Glycine max]KAH1156604.1 hypothetical protein GYH30_051412 [Glycine max]